MLAATLALAMTISGCGGADPAGSDAGSVTDPPTTGDADGSPPPPPPARGTGEPPGADDPAPRPDEPADPTDDTRDADDPHPSAPDERDPDQPHGLQRSVWVHLFDDTLKTRAGLERLVAELVAADATAVIAQVARRHDAYYRSEVLPATADPALEPGLDVVAELTRLAHAEGIEVHAWISVAPTWHAVYDELPAPTGWLPARHGQRAPEAERWVTRTHDGTWSDFLDPGLPEVRAHVAAIVHELATTTAVDGIHLDYVRYAADEAGYHPDALARFRAETGAAGTPDPEDPVWADWRREQTRLLVADARAALDDAGREVTLSAAVIAWGPGPTESGGFAATRTGREVFQDWPGWARTGLVDAVLPMVYFREHVPEQDRWFGDWLGFLAELRDGSDTQVIAGVGGWLNQPDATRRQLGAALATTDGAALYSYQQPTDRPADVAGGPEDLAARPASRPFAGELARTGWGTSDARP